MSDEGENHPLNTLLALVQTLEIEPHDFAQNLLEESDLLGSA